MLFFLAEAQYHARIDRIVLGIDPFAAGKGQEQMGTEGTILFNEGV